jgi:hypothetical protein
MGCSRLQLAGYTRPSNTKGSILVAWYPCLGACLLTPFRKANLGWHGMAYMMTTSLGPLSEQSVCRKSRGKDEVEEPAEGRGDPHREVRGVALRKSLVLCHGPRVDHLIVLTFHLRSMTRSPWPACLRASRPCSKPSRRTLPPVPVYIPSHPIPSSRPCPCHTTLASGHFSVFSLPHSLPSSSAYSSCSLFGFLSLFTFAC